MEQQKEVERTCRERKRNGRHAQKTALSYAVTNDEKSTKNARTAGRQPITRQTKEKQKRNRIIKYSVGNHGYMYSVKLWREKVVPNMSFYRVSYIERHEIHMHKIFSSCKHNPTIVHETNLRYFSIDSLLQCTFVLR